MGIAGVVAVAAVAATAAAVGRAVGGRSPVSVVLAGVVVAYVEIGALSLLLSPGARLTPAWFALAATSIAVPAIVLTTRGHHDAPNWTASLVALRSAVAKDRALVALALTVTIALAYALALALFTPPAEGDALAYHIARAAYWVQQHGVGPVPGNVDPRIDEFPPGAELAVAFTMLTTGGMRFVGLVQLVALLTATVSIFGLARRIGIEPGRAVLGALLFPTLSVVALQAPTALNDVVVAALVGIAAYFLLGTRRIDTVLGALALGALAMTKVTAAVAVPGVMIVAFVGMRRARGRRDLALATAAAVVPAILWVAIGPPSRAEARIAGVPTDYLNLDVDLVATVARSWILLTQALDLPGAAGRDALVYGIVGLGVLVVSIVGRDHGRRTAALVAGLVAGTMLLIPVGDLAGRTYRKFWYLVGRRDLETLDTGHDSTWAEATYSWYGPVALVLACGALVVTARLARRWERDLVPLALSTAPLVWIVGFALLAGYVPTTGRYLMGSVVLSAATWGLVLAWRPIVWWAVTVSAVTVGLAYVHFHERPSGLRLLEDDSPESVWTRPDAVALGPSSETPPVFAFVEHRVPDDARVGVWPHFWWSPFFGPSLSRTVLLTPSLTAAERLAVEWAILPVDAGPACVPGWATTLISGRFRAYERVAEARCR